MRFYEALVLGVVPVVRSMEEDAHRSPEELTVGYRVALAGGGHDEFPHNTTEAASHNLKLFENFHMLPIPYVNLTWSLVVLCCIYVLCSPTNNFTQSLLSFAQICIHIDTSFVGFE